MGDTDSKKGRDAMKQKDKGIHPYGLDFQLITLRQAETDLGEFQWRYRELDDACCLVEQARKKVAAKRLEIESRRKAFEAG